MRIPKRLGGVLANQGDSIVWDGLRKVAKWGSAGAGGGSIRADFTGRFLSSIDDGEYIATHVNGQLDLPDPGLVAGRAMTAISFGPIISNGAASLFYVWDQEDENEGRVDFSLYDGGYIRWRMFGSNADGSEAIYATADVENLTGSRVPFPAEAVEWTIHAQTGTALSIGDTGYNDGLKTDEAGAYWVYLEAIFSFGSD